MFHFICKHGLTAVFQSADIVNTTGRRRHS